MSSTQEQQQAAVGFGGGISSSGGGGGAVVSKLERLAQGIDDSIQIAREDLVRVGRACISRETFFRNNKCVFIVTTPPFFPRQKRRRPHFTAPASTD